MSVYDYDSLKQHIGHNIVCVSYGNDRNVSLECEDCNEVLLSYDKEEKKDFLVICPECQEMFDVEEWNLSTFNNNYDENYNALALDENGEEFVLEGEGLLARAIQHENDHLDGILFIDR